MGNERAEFHIAADLPILPQLQVADRLSVQLRAEGQFEAHSALLQQINAEIKRALVDPIAAIMRDTNAAMTHMEPAAVTLGQWGWTIPSFGPIPLTHHIVETIPRANIDASFIHTYDRGWRKEERKMLQRLVESPGLGQWRPILREVTYCYRRKKYRVAVPALLSVFEGALAFAMDRSADHPRPGTHVKQHHDTLPAGMERLGWASLQGFVSAVFGFHSFRDEPPDGLNRHWVQHGRGYPDSGRVECLRLFQALDTLDMVGLRRHQSPAI